MFGTYSTEIIGKNLFAGVFGFNNNIHFEC